MPTLSDLKSISSLASRGLVLTGPQNAPLSDGRQVAIWETTSNKVRFKLLEADGSLAGSARTVASSSGTIGEADMAVLSDGGFIISYVHVESGNSEIRAIRYSDTGAQLGSEMRLFTPALKKMFSP